ncbi:MAG: TIR domain-containing protein, partial [Chloroflexi bacterium]|nr:TIR domain-containing protein [Chloroflexota bacterium]
MPDSDVNRLNAVNANFGTQIFYGAVYIVAPATAGAPAAAPPIRVFFSYARADDGEDYDDPDKSLLRRLSSDLTAAGFAVWWDRVSLPSRSLSFSAEIEAAIASCDRFLLVAGPGAKDSEWVQAEMKCARDHCRPITVMLRGGDFGHIPDDLASVNAIDFRPPRAYAAALGDLSNRLRQPAPVAPLLNVKPLPGFYLNRPAPFKAARDALCADSIAPAVISAPPRATALFGYGGIGKSTLAAALAHDCQVRRTFHDGIIWLEVGQTPTPAALLAHVGATVFNDSRDNYQTENDAKLALAKVLQNKTALIVLDDVWDHRVVGFFPIEGTACRLLITTRSGALAQKVEGADIRLDLLTPDEGAALIAGITSPPDPLSTAERGSLDRYRDISERLGGHTLAIELAARQLKNGYADDADDLLRLLTKGDNPFAHLKLSEDDKNENLEKSLWLSYDNLGKDLSDEQRDDLKRRFRALGVLALEGSFDRAALAALWGDADPDAARAPLRALLDAGLVEALTPGPSPERPSEAGRAEAAPAKPRYSQHRLLRAYARALLEERGELEAAAARHFDYFADTHGQKRDHTNTDYLQSITVDVDNLLAALNWALQHAVEPACDLLNALDNYFRVYQSTSVYRPLLEQALTSAEAAGYVPGLANTLKALGDLSVRLDELDAARAFYDRALPLYEQIGARLGLANTL